MKSIKFLVLALSAGLAITGFAQTQPAATPPAATTKTVAAAPVTSDDANLRSAVDLIRADIKAEKAVIIAQHLPLTADESAEFWPLYNEYNAALGKLLDERLVILKDYVATYDTLTNEQAAVLAGKVFDWEGKRTALKREWFAKFTAVIPAKKAAQFFQIENQINAALDVQLMDALPLIK